MEAPQHWGLSRHPSSHLEAEWDKASLVLATALYSLFKVQQPELRTDSAPYSAMNYDILGSSLWGARPQTHGLGEKVIHAVALLRVSLTKPEMKATDGKLCK